MKLNEHFVAISYRCIEFQLKRRGDNEGTNTIIIL